MDGKYCVNPRCDNEGSPEHKYCAQCGWPLPVTCFSCQYDNPPQAESCLQCSITLGVFAEDEVIRKKVLTQYFEALRAGKKKYELRLGDFEVAEEDVMLLEEQDSQGQLTGRALLRKVTYVGKFKLNDLPWSLVDIAKYGLQIISLE